MGEWSGSVWFGAVESGADYRLFVTLSFNNNLADAGLDSNEPNVAGSYEFQLFLENSISVTALNTDNIESVTPFGPTVSTLSYFSPWRDEDVSATVYTFSAPAGLVGSALGGTFIVDFLGNGEIGFLGTPGSGGSNSVSQVLVRFAAGGELAWMESTTLTPGSNIIATDYGQRVAVGNGFYTANGSVYEPITSRAFPLWIFENRASLSPALNAGPI